MRKHTILTIAVLAGSLFHPSGAFAQASNGRAFDCGTIRLSPSGSSQIYEDLGQGFRFEFPPGWNGSKVFVQNTLDNNILINPLLATSDPKFYVSEGAKVTGTEVIKGQEWTALVWPDGRRGYYAYHEGVAIEFVAGILGKNSPPSAVTLATLNQILSSFTFLDDTFRLDRQLSALHVGQKLGGLTIERKPPGNTATRGFSGNLARIEFSGRLTLTGNVQMAGTMHSRDWYFIDSLDAASRSLVPLLSCAVDQGSILSNVPIGFTNQDFARELLGEHGYNGYLAHATVVVDKLSESYGSATTRPIISARLISVTDLKNIQ